MINFKTLVQDEVVKAELDAAYVLGSEDYYKGKLCLPPKSSIDAYRDYLDGYFDAQYLCSIEKFESRVA